MAGCSLWVKPGRASVLGAGINKGHPSGMGPAGQVEVGGGVLAEATHFPGGTAGNEGQAFCELVAFLTHLATEF